MPITPNRETVVWDETVDVVVVGSGFAGLAAAIEAHDAGASVMILEKMDKPGGNSWINGGQVAAAGSAAQKKQGIKDSPDLMYSDMLAAGLGLNHPALARIVAEQSNAAVEWTMRRVGAAYKDQINMMGGHSVPRTLQTANGHGSEVVGKQVEALKKANVPITLHAEITGLHRDRDGRVIGVAVRKEFNFGEPGSGLLKNVRARKGVVLACGGFSEDLHFRTVQDPRLTADYKTTNQPGATAEGLIAALRLGAASVQLDQIQLLPLTSPDDEGIGSGCGFIAGCGMAHGLLIDPASGKRFVSELDDRKNQSDAIIACGHPAISIADSYGAKFAWWGLDHSIESGTVGRFDTLAALAAHYKIDPGTLAKTVEDFNGYVTAKHDPEFGKLILKDARPLTTAPFYAARVWPKVHHTMGGVEINGQAEVIDLDGAVIPGLFAAGEITGGVHGACRLGSVAIIDCLVFGRIAGRSVAAGIAAHAAAA
jgi:flavocytochrome c|nr:flavocytochrome c [uncultured Rhodopila sp.]